MLNKLNNLLIKGMITISANDPQGLVDKAMSPENDYFSSLTKTGSDAARSFNNMLFVFGITLGVGIFVLGVVLRMTSTTGQSGQRWKSVAVNALICVGLIAAAASIIGFIISVGTSIDF